MYKNIYTACEYFFYCFIEPDLDKIRLELGMGMSTQVTEVRNCFNLLLHNYLEFLNLIGHTWLVIHSLLS